MSRWLKRVGVALLALALVALGALGEWQAPRLLGLGGPTPARMLADSLQSFRTAKSFHMQGSLTVNGTAYLVGLDEDDLGGVTGAIQEGPLDVSVFRSGGKTLLQGSRYFSSQTPPVYVGARWVAGAKGSVIGLVAALANRAALADGIKHAASGEVTSSPGFNILAQKTINLVGGGVSVHISSVRSGPPLAVFTVPGTALPGGLTDLSLVFSNYGKPFTFQEPSPIANLADPNTLPVHVVGVLDTFAYENCDANGCSTSVQFRNDGGKDGADKVIVTFKVRRSGQDLASCTVTLPVLGNGETTQQGCRLNYDRTVSSVTANFSINNPPP